MVKTLLLSAAYSWFIGLLVIMLVMAVLFVVIALFALKPYKLEGEEYDGAAEMQRLLNEKEAELAVKLLNADGADKMELEYKLREVATAKLVVKDIISDVDVAASPNFGVDSSLTEEEAKALENGEKVSIEQTFNSAEPEGDGLKKSFTAKLMQAGDDIKVWYFELKNCILCYEKTKEIMRWNNEKFYIGRSNVAALTMRGKQLCLYLAVKAEDYADKYPVKVSTSDMYNAATPCLFRIKNYKNVQQAKELISLMMSDYGVMYVRTNHSIYALPYQDDDALVAKGLAKKE